MIVTLLVWLATAGLAGIGGAAVFAPAQLSRLYGVPVHDEAAFAYVRASGFRDILLAGLLAYAVLSSDSRMVGAVCVACAGLAILDFLATMGSSNWHMKREHLSHLGGFIGFAILAYLTVPH